MKVNLNYLLLFLGLFGCQTAATHLEEPASNDVISSSITEVQITTAEIRPFVYTISSKGKLTSAHETDIYAKTSGLLTSLKVKNGSMVAKGQVLAQIENDKQKLNVEKARRLLEKRTHEFHKERIGYFIADHPEDSIQKRTEEKLKIKHGIPEAELQLKEASLLLAYTTIRATQTGIVANLFIKEGNLITENATFCKIYDPNHLLVETQILESEIGKLKIGQQAQIKTTMHGEKIFKARLAEYNPLVNEKNGMVHVKLTMQSYEGLFPGMNVSSAIEVPYQDNIIIPKSAIVVRSGKHVVFVEEKGKAKWKYIKLGRESLGEVEVTEGLTPSERVITTNSLQLAHDSPVKVASEL